MLKFISLGCKVNSYESNALRELFFLKGFKEESKPEEKPEEKPEVKPEVKPAPKPSNEDGEAPTGITEDFSDDEEEMAARKPISFVIHEKSVWSSTTIWLSWKRYRCCASCLMVSSAGSINSERA